MALDDWPERDRRWAARYILCLAKEGVTLEASDARQSELIAAAEAAGAPAADVFGDADLLAAADASDIAQSWVPTASISTGGLRSRLDAVGFVLLFLGLAASIVVVSGGATSDITFRGVVLAAIVAAATFLGGEGMGAFAEGRLRTAAALVVGCVGVIVGGVALMMAVGADRILVADAPWWITIPALFVPGALLIVAARLVPAQGPTRKPLTADEWFGRFRGALLSAGVSAGATREHERTLRSDSVDVGQEYGDPVVFARRLAAQDDSAIDRRRSRKTWGIVLLVALLAFNLATSESDGALWGFQVVLVVLAAAALAPSVWNGIRSHRERGAG
ncbi:hypothetical protein TPB0596_04960 [Tsukamurella pulmonis]|uniref:hypothetical protein n=1 Tax=Tsukamurella pulmonis TaxID=47312 RepID=UPI001EDF9F3D|nr:hypothetical protein [Tsukamurella pulmonis]BDD80733.1 hypothetical protein TPB0596_04960 [Tsukamurella pulmonis]